MSGTLQRFLDLARKLECAPNAPLRQQSGVHHRVVRIGVHHLARAQPLEELVAVRRAQHVFDSVAPVGLAYTCRDREQIEVVVP